MNAEMSFEQALLGLRDQFVAGCADRFDRIEQFLSQLEADPADAGALRDLMFQFHGFSGSGSTYGFPRVTVLGLEGERLCQALLKEAQKASERERDRFRTLLDSLREEIRTEPAAPAERPPVESQFPSDILVVDADPQLRASIALLAGRDGLDTRAAGNGFEAIEELDRKLPDAAIIDAGLPEGSGYELVERIRCLPGGDRVAVLMLGGHSAFAGRVDAIHCGADGFFEKPFEADALLRRLEHLLERGRTDPPRVLSVEDDPDQAAYIRAVLESAGYVVRIGREPRNLESDLSIFRPDLVLLDIHLPGTSGFALARCIRQQEAYAALPILFLTTRGQIESQIESMRAGGDDYLVKPVAPGLLLSAVASRIERARFVKSLLERDGLTRLLTHTAFLERARARVEEKPRRSPTPPTLIIVDLDDFKSLNDRYGHPAGDGVLRSLAGLLRRRLRQSDILGRLGGDEFAAIIENIGENQAVRLVEKIREEYSEIEQTAGDGSRFRATFSAGVAVLEPGHDVRRWRDRADAALYAAKSKGRSRVAAAAGAGAGF